MARSADSYPSHPTNPSSIKPPHRPMRNPPRAITENPLFLLDLLNARVIYDCVPVKANRSIRRPRRHRIGLVECSVFGKTRARPKHTKTRHTTANARHTRHAPIEQLRATPPPHDDNPFSILSKNTCHSTTLPKAKRHIVAIQGNKGDQKRIKCEDYFRTHRNAEQKSIRLRAVFISINVENGLK